MPGVFESIICSWNGEDTHRLEWFVEEFDSLPIASETNSSSVVLAPDVSASGLNGTNFTCRATTHKGDVFNETVSLRFKSNLILPHSFSR